MKYLIIVESPSKCKKIKSYLSKCFPSDTFNVIASVGHFMNLSKKKMGVDIKNNYKPYFEFNPDKKKVINNMKKCAKETDNIIIATDLDAEGEKIAYDISKLLNLDLKKKNRMIFNEITQKALKKSFENLTTVNMDLVHAQFARRILDRLIGFELSAITAKEIQRGASAGRVLSVTTKLVKEKEDEIKNTQKETFFHIHGDFINDKYKLLDTIGNKEYKKQERLEDVFSKLYDTTYHISNVETINKKQSPPIPFITSTINQCSPYTLKQTTSILQKLYQHGHITYIRTDSPKMSNDAKTMIKTYICKNYGENIFQFRIFGKKVKGAQEAHECIRPTHINVLPSQITDPYERKIYDLIWKRSVACLMKDSEYILKKIKITPSNLNLKFLKNLKKFTFLGWKQIYTTLDELNKDLNNFNEIKENDIIKDIQIKGIQKYNKSPGRYTESNLVKTLEKLGIGRPSTYSSTITNVQNKLYAIKKNISGEKVKSLIMIYKDKEIQKTYIDEIINEEKNKLVISELGIKITEYLNENFDVIMNYQFTSQIESDLDDIKNKKLIWYNVIDKYYRQFHPQVIHKKEILKKLPKNNNQFLIGTYNNKNFYRFNSPYGPRVMYGEKGEKDTLYLYLNGKVLSKITLDDAIKLLPKSIGKYKEYDITLHFAKSLYIKWNNKNIPLLYSMKNKTKDNLSLNDCISCIECFLNKKNKKSKKKK